MAFCSGAYLTLPIVVLNLGESASAGTGMTISTLLAVERRLNCDFALIMYSTRLCAWRSITDSIQMSGFTWVFSRYDISSNSPSGGMNEIVRSFSNRDSRTH
uniref:Putative secreted protein n=1 Tax=Anopheles triannulatus TaxID=58253 RepID=A0A2M4B2M4_9DIPT